jgi:hypothetical protein
MPSEDFELIAHYAPDLERQLRALEALLTWPPLDREDAAPAAPALPITQDTPSEEGTEMGDDDGT